MEVLSLFRLKFHLWLAACQAFREVTGALPDSARVSHFMKPAEILLQFEMSSVS